MERSAILRLLSNFAIILVRRTQRTNCRRSLIINAWLRDSPMNWRCSRWYSLLIRNGCWWLWRGSVSPLADLNWTYCRFHLIPTLSTLSITHILMWREFELNPRRNNQRNRTEIGIWTEKNQEKAKTNKWTRSLAQLQQKTATFLSIFSAAALFSLFCVRVYSPFDLFWRKNWMRSMPRSREHFSNEENGFFPAPHGFCQILPLFFTPILFFAFFSFTNFRSNFFLSPKHETIFFFSKQDIFLSIAWKHWN